MAGLESIKAELHKTPVQLGVLFGTLALYIVAVKLFPGRDQPVPTIFGMLVFVEMIGFVFMEIKDGAHAHGWKHEAIDTLIALGVALMVWVLAGFLLNTSSPVSGVVSCSMKPNLQRGDFVVLQGAQASAYQISMDKSELDALSSGLATVSFNGSTFQAQGSLYAWCGSHINESACRSFVRNPEEFTETTGPFTYKYGKCTVSYDDGSTALGPCVTSVSFRGTEYATNFSHDTIVYQPPQGSLFAQFGDIVHRAFFEVDVGGEKYYITRGDNNQMLDIQMYSDTLKAGNAPIPAKNVKGKVIGRVPVLGYFKLLLHGFVNEDEQCRWQLGYTHV